MIIVLFYENFSTINAEPVIFDKTLKVEKISGDLNYPVSMSFLDSNDIMILEKDSGMVRHIVNGQILDDLLHINVDYRGEGGLIGSAVGHNSSGNMYVFLYFSKINTSIINGTYTKVITENNLYRYNFIDGKLVNPELLYKIPTEGHHIHNSGKMIVGPDNNLYLMIGNLLTSKHTLTNNYLGGSIDGSGGIIRLTFDGLPVDGILSDDYPRSLYYSYGIRNGFGLDFDPVTGNLWDTENGPSYGDEINLVQPGFNSGWNKVQGIWEPDTKVGEHKGNLFVNLSKLVTFNGKGQYSSPEYIWDETIGVTSLKFLNSTNLGSNYENDMFVGDYKNGNIYHFDLNTNRTKIIDRNAVMNKDQNNENILIYSEKGYPTYMKEFTYKSTIQNNTDTNLLSDSHYTDYVLFGKGFGHISDMQVAPDGSLYILSFSGGDDTSIGAYNKDGAIYRITKR